MTENSAFIIRSSEGAEFAPFRLYKEGIGSYVENSEIKSATSYEFKCLINDVEYSFKIELTVDKVKITTTIPDYLILNELEFTLE